MHLESLSPHPKLLVQCFKLFYLPFSSSSFCHEAILFRTQVNEKIVVLACVLLDCEYIDKKNYTLLGIAADYLKDTSGFNAKGWDLMKLVTALMIIRNPAETNIADKEVILLY